MRLVFERKALAQELKALKDACPGHPVLPILTDILVVKRRDEAQLVATDLDAAIIATVPAKGSTGSVLLPLRNVLDLLGHNNGDQVTVAVNGKRLQLKANRAVFQYPYHDPNDYPPVPKAVKKADAVIGGEALRGAIGKVAHAVAKADSRPVLNGIYLEFTRGEARLTAADGFRLVTVAIPASGKAKGSAIIPGRTAQLVRRHLQGEEIAVSLGERLAQFSCGNRTILGQRIEGTYPNYQQLVPKNGKVSAMVDPKELAKAVKLVVSGSDGDRPVVRLEKARGKLKVWANGDEHECSTTIAAQGKGEGRIAFSPTYLLDAMAIAEGKAILKWNEPSAPCLVTSEGTTAKEVMMPYFVQW